MDHFLDFIFLCSLVFVGYMISPTGLGMWNFGLLTMAGSFLVNAFLLFAATNEFKIYRYGIGPTELRFMLIVINTFIIFFGTSQFSILLPIFVILSSLGLALNTYQIHKRLWAIDVKNRESVKR